MWREALLGVCVLGLVACGGAPGSPQVIAVGDTTEDASALQVLVATCDLQVGGPVELRTDTAFEAWPNYDEELAAQDVDGLPDEIDLSKIGSLPRALVAYMLEIDLDELPEAMARDAITEGGEMGRAILGAFAENAKGDLPGLDLAFLRRGLHRFYQCDRGWPLRLEDFKAEIYDFTDLAGYEVHSVPKDTTRRLREDHAAGVYVGEAIWDGEVRETEILLASHRSDGALDFVAYDADGDLVDRGEFTVTTGAKIGAAAPYVCISCHFEAGTFRIQVIFPDMGPVAPQEDSP